MKINQFVNFQTNYCKFKKKNRSYYKVLLENPYL